MKPDDNKNLIAALTASPIYRDYAQAFSETTGLPIAMRPVESWHLPHHGHRRENPFCAMLAETSASCAACLRVQEDLRTAASDAPATVTCAFGLCDTAVPVRLGEKAIGYLLTGQAFRRKPTRLQFNRTTALLTKWGLKFDRAKLERLYFETPVVPARRYESIVKMLAIFAEHLSIVSNRILVQRASVEPPMIARARQFIEAHNTEDLSLGQVAKAVNTSPFYFSKMFKKFSGVNFTEYVSRIRLEKAKNLLLNRNLQVSEIAYEVGFQSLTHFNRVFKRFVQQSPTEFRAQLPTV